MKKLIPILLLLCAFIHADIRIPGAANYQVIGRGLTWASGINQNFIMDVTSPSSGMCLQVHNNDGSLHTYTITPKVTSDLSTITYTGNTGAWTSTNISPSGNGNTAATSTDNYFINTSGAAHVVISITAGSGTGNADVLVSQTSNQCGVGGIGSIAQAVSCDRSFLSTPGAVGNFVVSIVPPAGQFIHVCGITITSAATGGNVQFENGSSGTCTTPSTLLWGYVFNSNTAPSTGGGIGQLFKTSVAAQPLCAVVAGTLTSLFISVSYTVF